MTDAQEFHAEKFDRPEAGAVIYRMSGVMGDGHACYEFLDTFKEELPGAPARIIFNLGKVETMFSNGVGIIAGCYSTSRKAGKQLVLVNVPEAIERILAITMIRPEVPAYATEDEALAAAQ